MSNMCIEIRFEVQLYIYIDSGESGLWMCGAFGKEFAAEQKRSTTGTHPNENRPFLGPAGMTPVIGS